MRAPRFELGAATLLCAVGCSSIFGLDAPQLRSDAAASDGPGTEDSSVAHDASPDAPSNVPFGNIALAFPSSTNDDDPSLTGDMLELYLDRSQDIYVTRRASVTDAWGTPARVVELSTNFGEHTPKVSSSGLLMTYGTNRTTSTSYDVWISIRPDRASTWSSPARFVPAASAGEDHGGVFSEDGLSFWFSSNRDGDFDIFVMTRANTTTNDWTAPVAVAGLNSSASDRGPVLTPDGQTIYFDSNRGGAFAIYRSRRMGTQWGPPQLVAELSVDGDAADPWVSADEKTIYFASQRGGSGPRIYRATR